MNDSLLCSPSHVAEDEPTPSWSRQTLESRARPAANHSARRLAVFGIVLGSLLQQGEPTRAADKPAIVLQVLDDGNFDVHAVRPEWARSATPAEGIIIWTEGAKGYWGVSSSDSREATPIPRAWARCGAELFATAARSAALRAAIEIIPPLANIKVFLGRSALKETGGFLTPQNNSRLLRSRFTVRRAAGKSGILPTVTASLSDDDGFRLRIPFAEGQVSRCWSDIPGLPPEFANGLPPGSYRLQFDDQPDAISFTVADAAERERVLAAIDELKALRGGEHRDDAVGFLAELNLLLGNCDDNGDRVPFLTEALDLLESGRAAGSQRAFTREIAEYLNGVAGPSDAPANSEGAIETAIALSEHGRWSDAIETLAAYRSEDSAKQAFVDLCTVVVRCESGEMDGRLAEEALKRGVEALEQARRAAPLGDAARASEQLLLGLVWYGSYKLNEAVDLLYSPAVADSDNGVSPLYRAFQAWSLANEIYERALRLCETGLARPAYVQVVQLNRARLFVLLCDLLAAFSETKPSELLSKMQGTAEDNARALCVSVLSTSGGVSEPAVAASAHELLGHLDLHAVISTAGSPDRVASHLSSCLSHAEKAEDLYLSRNSLAGIESVYCLYGLRALAVERLSRPESDRGAGDTALNPLLIAHYIAEVLRETFPTDRIGRSRARFFARHTFVNDLLVDLLVQRGKPGTALRVAESAKARCLSDILAHHGLAAECPAILRVSEGQQRIANWPGDIAAIEYYLSSDRGWLFCVTVDGTVKAFLLREGNVVVSPHTVVERVRRFLAQMDHYAQRLRLRLTARRGFDSEWQDELLALRLLLLPDAVLAEAKRAKVVVIAPHNILHYLPFSALVVEGDNASRGLNDIVRPRFLVDELDEMVFTPSVSAWMDQMQDPVAISKDAFSVGTINGRNGLPPLDGVAADLKSWRGAFGGNVREELVDSAATPSALMALLKQPGCILVATHGENVPERPLDSFLQLFPDRSGGSRLSARDLYMSDIAAELVVLSACYSAIADRAPLAGDDLFGIQRAVLQSGARTVISGLWDVFDSTAPELLQYFQRSFAGGAPAASALASAQREFLRKYRSTGEPEPYLHPYFWAVFTVTGDHRTRFQR